MDRKFTFLLIGVIFWASAAFLMHFIGPYVLGGDWIHIVFWIANFFLPAIALPIIAKITNRTKNQMLVPTILIAIPAMTLDALSVTFDTFGFTHIYADNAILAGSTGGFLLFAFVSFFVWALIWHKD